MRVIRSSLEGKGRPQEQEVKEGIGKATKARGKGRKRTGFRAALLVAQEVKKSAKVLQEFLL